MKIFEKLELKDGGPNDKGKVIGYIEASTLEAAKKILNIDHGFIVLNEINLSTFLHRRSLAIEQLKMFDLKT